MHHTSQCIRFARAGHRARHPARPPPRPPPPPKVAPSSHRFISKAPPIDSQNNCTVTQNARSPEKIHDIGVSFDQPGLEAITSNAGILVTSQSAL